MPGEIVMPRLSDTMESGTIARWLKHEGDAVQKGEQIADIETDKATMPFESYAAGTLAKILLPEGQSAAIGTPIAVVAAPGEAVAPTPAAPAAPAAKAPPAPATAPPTAPSAASATEPEGAVRASPIARRLAEEMGIDLRVVTGTGPGGRITREDVEEAARAAVTPAPVAPPATPKAEVAPLAPPAAPTPLAPPTAPPVERPLTRMQQTIARRMFQSKTTVPHFYVTVEVDMAEATRLREQLIKAWPEVRLGFSEMIVKGVAIALEAYPLVNASWHDDHIVYHEDVNVGVAVSVEGGLLVPVLHQVNRTNLRTLAARIKELVQRTREGHSKPGDFEGGTFSVSSLGQYPIENFLAIVNPPESAILSVSRIEKKPVARGDEIVLSERVHLSLSCDHRVFYGHYAAEFLTKLKDVLEQPLSLLG
jgi:pyruvate dehydrogenase E2 component (dihydrolipoamide acetyltransferase)